MNKLITTVGMMLVGTKVVAATPEMPKAEPPPAVLAVVRVNGQDIKLAFNDAPTCIGLGLAYPSAAIQTNCVDNKNDLGYRISNGQVVSTVLTPSGKPPSEFAKTVPVQAIIAAGELTARSFNDMSDCANWTKAIKSGDKDQLVAVTCIDPLNGIAVRVLADGKAEEINLSREYKRYRDANTLGLRFK